MQGAGSFNKIGELLGLGAGAGPTLKRHAKEYAASGEQKWGKTTEEGLVTPGSPPVPSNPDALSQCDNGESPGSSTPPPASASILLSLHVIWAVLNKLKAEREVIGKLLGQLGKAVVQAALSTTPADAFDDIHVGQKGEKGDSAPEDGDLPI